MADWLLIRVRKLAGAQPTTMHGAPNGHRERERERERERAGAGAKTAAWDWNCNCPKGLVQKHAKALIEEGSTLHERALLSLILDIGLISRFHFLRFAVRVRVSEAFYDRSDNYGYWGWTLRDLKRCFNDFAASSRGCQQVC